MKHMINAIMFDEGSVSISYMDTSEAVREDGKMYLTSTINLSSESSLWSQVEEIRDCVEDLIEDSVQLYRNNPPYIHSETVEEEDDDECGMGF